MTTQAAIILDSYRGYRNVETTMLCSIALQLPEMTHIGDRIPLHIYWSPRAGFIAEYTGGQYANDRNGLLREKTVLSDHIVRFIKRKLRPFRIRHLEGIIPMSRQDAGVLLTEASVAGQTTVH